MIWSCCFLPLAFGATTKICYQGQLREQGVPVSGVKSMVFRIYGSSTSSSALWTSGSQQVSVLNGLFRVLLDPTGVNWEGTPHLEVEVAGITLSPREELTAAPFSVNSRYLSGKSYASGPSAPSSPAEGDLWFNTSTDILNVWSGSSWDALGSGGVGGSLTVEEGDIAVVVGAASLDFSGGPFIVTSGPAGEANVDVDASSVTLQGNTFNAANRLVQLSGAGALPALNGAALTNLTPANVQAGSLPSNVFGSSVAAGAVGNAHVAAAAAIQLSKLEKDPSAAGVINTSTNPVDWSQLKNVPAGLADGTDASSLVVEENDATVDANTTDVDFLGAHFNVTSSPAGEANVSLDASSVTLAGNSFNGSNQLVKLDASGQLALSGWATITTHLSAAASLNFGMLASAGTCESLSIGVPGAADGDTVYLGVPNALQGTHIVFYAYVSAANLVTVKRCGLQIDLTDPPAANIRVDVWQH